LSSLMLAQLLWRAAAANVWSSSAVVIRWRPAWGKALHCHRFLSIYRKSVLKFLKIKKIIIICWQLIEYIPTLLIITDWLVFLALNLMNNRNFNSLSSTVKLIFIIEIERERNVNKSQLKSSINDVFISDNALNRIVFPRKTWFFTQTTITFLFCWIFKFPSSHRNYILSCTN
jgi:hypothetical protein